MNHLLNCGYNFMHPEGIVIDRPKGASNYAFVFFRSNAEVVVQGVRQRVEKNSFILFRPDTPHLYRNTDELFINDWIHFEGEETGHFMSKINFPLDTIVKAADPLFITRSVIELQRINRIGGPLRDAIIDNDIRALFMKLSNLLERTALPEQTSRYFSQFSELRSDLYNSPHLHLSVEQLASRINMSKSYFQHVYKQIFGCSVVADMINSRLDYAKYLLDNSSLSVAAIAKTCGYENDTHFMRQFKKFVGLTPSQYKQGGTSTDS